MKPSNISLKSCIHILIGVEIDLTQTQFYMVCKQIDEDPEQNIDKEFLAALVDKIEV